MTSFSKLCVTLFLFCLQPLAVFASDGKAPCLALLLDAGQVIKAPLEISVVSVGPQTNRTELATQIAAQLNSIYQVRILDSRSSQSKNSTSMPETPPELRGLFFVPGPKALIFTDFEYYQYWYQQMILKTLLQSLRANGASPVKLILMISKGTVLHLLSEERREGYRYPFPNQIHRISL